MMSVPSLAWEIRSNWEHAKACKKCLYVFIDKNGHTLYIGKATDFGTRYAHGYRYLVDALIQSGAQLFIAELGHEWMRVKDYEGTLISQYGGAGHNRRIGQFNPVKGLKLPKLRRVR